MNKIYILELSQLNRFGLKHDKIKKIQNIDG